MTKNEVKKLIKYYSILFPATKITADDDTVNVWFELLSDIRFLDAKSALKELSIKLHRIPNVTDIVQHVGSEDFRSCLYDTYQEYPYVAKAEKLKSTIQVAVAWNDDKKVVFEYPLNQKAKALNIVSKLKSKLTASEIMCLWDEDMANFNYGTCKRKFNL